MVLANTNGLHINGNSLSTSYDGTTLTFFVFVEAVAICSLTSDGNVTVQIGG